MAYLPKMETTLRDAFSQHEFQQGLLELDSPVE